MALRQADSQFFDTFMLVIGILMGAAVGLFFLARAISIDTQGKYIRSDPEVLAEVSKPLEPVGHVLKLGNAGAPPLGDADAWAPRIAKGNDTLHQVTDIRPIPRIGPARGGACAFLVIRDRFRRCGAIRRAPTCPRRAGSPESIFPS